MNSVNVFEIEQLRRKCFEFDSDSASSPKKLFSFYKYFDLLLSSNNNTILEAYLHEFIEDYCNAICKIDPFGFNPDFIKNLLQQITALKSNELLVDNSQILLRCEEKLSSTYEIIMSILRGESTSQHFSAKTYFPLIDKEASENIFVVIESVTIKISKGDKDNKFIIVPSEKEIEERLIAQVRISWFAALKEIKRFVSKLLPFHEVLISFNKAEGFYEGNSLGLTLTLSFIEELLKFYNPTYSIHIKESTAFTGAIDENGNVSNTGTEIIKIKMAGVFFSPLQTFVIPKEDEDEAKKKLSLLRETYPNRNLKLIAVEELNDVLNRRDIVEIKKVSPIVRTGIFIKKNWVSAAVSIALTFLLAFLFVFDFDENPALLDHDDYALYVKNKSGKVLWTKKQNFSTPYKFSENFKKNFFRILDVNNDGINEVLVAAEIFPEEKFKEKGRITCYNFDGTERWNYYFKDTVKTKRENFTGNWNDAIMFDTATLDRRKILICSISNSPSFANAIFKLDLKTGKRLPGTFWHPGHCGNGLVKDLDSDGRQELIVLGCNNSFNQVNVIFVLPVDGINGHPPTTEEYRFYEFPPAPLKAYIKIPQTDFCKYYKLRNSYTLGETLEDKTELSKIFFISVEHPDANRGGLQYYFDYNLKDFDIVISSTFAFSRDELVRQKILSPPFSDTKEYCEIIKNQILYWNGKEFVHRQDLK